MDASIDFIRRIVPATSTDFVVPSIIDFPLAGAAIDLKFTTSEIYPSGAFTDYLSCSRASIGYAKTSSGTLTQFAANTLRITDLGLLVEDARENLAYPSIPDDSWTSDNCTPTVNSTTAPDGTSSATKISEDAVTNYHSYYPIPSLADATYSGTIYIKDGNTGFAIVFLQQWGGSYNYAYAGINLSTGSIVDSGSTGPAYLFVSASVEAYADGWWRVSVIGTKASGGIVSAPLGVILSRDGLNANINYAGDANKYIYVWGAQLEQASFPSSYIPTTTTSATRAADVVVCAGDLLATIKGTDCSVVMSLIAYGGDFLDNRFLTTPSQHYHLYSWGSTSVRSYNVDGADIGATLGGGATYTIGTKIAAAWDSSGRSICGGGGSIASDAHALTTTQDAYIAYNHQWYGYCRRLTAWNSRLADATLQGFTAP